MKMIESICEKLIQCKNELNKQSFHGIPLYNKYPEVIRKTVKEIYSLVFENGSKKSR